MLVDLLPSQLVGADIKPAPALRVGDETGDCHRSLDHGGQFFALGNLATYTTEAYAQTLASAIQAHAPYAVLVPSTVNGRDVAARVAARLRLGLTGDCIGFEVDAEGRLVQMKPAFGGNVVAPILSKTSPYMATVRPGLLEHLQPNEERQAPVISIPVEAPADQAVRVVATRREEAADAAELDDAWAVVTVG